MPFLGLFQFRVGSVMMHTRCPTPSCPKAFTDDQLGLQTQTGALKQTFPLLNQSYCVLWVARRKHLLTPVISCPPSALPTAARRPGCALKTRRAVPPQGCALCCPLCLGCSFSQSPAGHALLSLSPPIKCHCLAGAGRWAGQGGGPSNEHAPNSSHV